eukprot:6784930-Lingulodinium_polyedra.AAC.1
MLAAAEGMHSGREGPGPARRVALLSLFDGMGTARLASDGTLRALRSAGSLVGSFFAETDVPLGDA